MTNMHKKTIGILHGPNFCRLGKREPHLYGNKTLSDLQNLLVNESCNLGFSLLFFQSNHEGALIDKIEEWAELDVNGLIINPGAYAHTSIALMDALNGIDYPCVEVHLTDIHKREPFRTHSYTAQACIKLISGKGFLGYVEALELFAEKLTTLALEQS